MRDRLPFPESPPREPRSFSGTVPETINGGLIKVTGYGPVSRKNPDEKLPLNEVRLKKGAAKI